MKELVNKLQRGYPKTSEVIRFLIVGGFATLIDMLVMAGMIFVANFKTNGFDIVSVFFNANNTSTIVVVLATMVGFMVGLVFNYVLSNKFVYIGENKKARTKKGFLLFLILSAIGLLIQTVGMYIGYDMLKINEWLVKILLVLVVLVFNYITRKRFVFDDNLPLVAEKVLFTDKEKKLMERLCFIGLFLVYFVFAFAYMYILKTPKQGYIFGADTHRVFNDWNKFTSDHYRTKVHPLYVILIYPIFAFFKFLGADAYFVAVLFNAVVTTTIVYLFYKILQRLSKDKPNVWLYLLTVLFAFSFSILDNTIKTESFAVGCLTLLLFWCWFVYNHDKQLRFKDYAILIILGMLAVSMTITNYMQFMIGVSFLFIFRKHNSKKEFLNNVLLMIAVIIGSLALAFGLMWIQSLIFVTAENAFIYAYKVFIDILTGNNATEEVVYISTGSVTMIFELIAYYFGLAFVGGKLYPIDKYVFIAPSVLTYIVAVPMLVLFCYCLYKCFKSKNRIVLPFVFVLAFEMILHWFYGSGTLVLYLLHASFAVLIIVFVGLQEEVGRTKKYFLYGLLVIAGVSVLHSMINILDLGGRLYKDSGLSSQKLIKQNWDFFIFVAVISLVAWLIKWIVNYYKTTDGLKEAGFKSFYFRGITAICLSIILGCCFISIDIEDREAERIASLPPTHILMGLGQREKYYLMQEGEKYSFYYYDVETRESQKVEEGITLLEYDSINYTAYCVDKDLNELKIYEDEEGIYLKRNKVLEVLDDRKVNIPDFSECSVSELLKVSFYEAMVNCVPGGFCANYLYKPDLIGVGSGVMGLMLSATDNLSELDLMVDLESMNHYGELLFLLTLEEELPVSTINQVIEKSKQSVQNGLVCDSLYQTAWTKLALEKLGRDSSWCEYNHENPVYQECWFYEESTAENYTDNILKIGERLLVFERNWNPYNDIAKLHYYNIKASFQTEARYLCSYEYYDGMRLSPGLRCASELFMYLLEYDKMETKVQ